MDHWSFISSAGLFARPWPLLANQRCLMNIRIHTCSLDSPLNRTL